MSEYNTGNPVPSIDPRDLDDNATIFDLLLMQAVPSVPDRLGVLRKTWWQMEQDAAALVSPNVTALAAAVSAANKIFYFTGSGTGAVADFTAQARTFLAAANVAGQRTALDLPTGDVAPINSPTFTGTPAGPTPAVGTNTTQLATTAMIQSEIANKRAWTSYTPTVTAASGTWTSAAATGTHMGVFGMRNVEMQLTVTTKGTGITAILTLPVPAHASWIGRTLNARQANGSRKIGHAVIQDANTVFLTDYINAELVESNGTIININGAYREA